MYTVIQYTQCPNWFALLPSTGSIGNGNTCMIQSTVLKTPKTISISIYRLAGRNELCLKKTNQLILWVSLAAASYMNKNKVEPNHGAHCYSTISSSLSGTFAISLSFETCYTCQMMNIDYCERVPGCNESVCVRIRACLVYVCVYVRPQWLEAHWQGHHLAGFGPVTGSRWWLLAGGGS